MKDHSKRALRRHHRERLKRKRASYWLGYTWPMDERLLGMVVSTPHPCSSYCCGNPRKWFGELSIQERKYFQESIEENLDEV